MFEGIGNSFSTNNLRVTVPLPVDAPATPTHTNIVGFPPKIISHGVWRYFRFCLSYRDVEELLFAWGVMVTYEAIRK
jgi:hypothetical protein